MNHPVEMLPVPDAAPHFSCRARCRWFCQWNCRTSI